jgi:hypothetical protein
MWAGAVSGSQVTDKYPAVRLDALIGLAVPGRSIGPWSRRTGAPGGVPVRSQRHNSMGDGPHRPCHYCAIRSGPGRFPADNHGQRHGGPDRLDSLFLTLMWATIPPRG